MNILKTFLAASAVTLMAGAASAATVSCDGALADLVSPNGGCEISQSASQDFLNTNPTTVNAEMFFGVDDWVFIDKDEGTSNLAPSVDNELSINGTRTGGEWAIWEGLADTYSAGMLIFKDGNDTFLTGYLLADFNGTYGDVFSGKDISHVSLYARVDPIPLPAAGWLLLGGLGGLAAMKRRRKS